MESEVIRRTRLKHSTKPIRRNSPLKRAVHPKATSFPESLERVDWKGVMALKRKPAKRRPEDVNEDFLIITINPGIFQNEP